VLSKSLSCPPVHSGVQTPACATAPNFNTPICLPEHHQAISTRKQRRHPQQPSCPPSPTSPINTGPPATDRHLQRWCATRHGDITNLQGKCVEERKATQTYPKNAWQHSNLVWQQLGQCGPTQHHPQTGQKYQDVGTTSKHARGQTSTTGTLRNMMGCSAHSNT
jgi:hypothetical protein